MLHHGFPVIVYAFNGPALTDVRDTLAYLKRIGTHILLITNNAELSSEATDSLFIPGEFPEEITTFISVVCGQIFAYHFARAKGAKSRCAAGTTEGHQDAVSGLSVQKRKAGFSRLLFFTPLY